MKESLQITLRKNRYSEDLIQVTRKSTGQNVLHSYNQSTDAILEEQPFNEAECFENESEQLTEHAMNIFKALIDQPDFYNRFYEQAQTVYHKSHNIKPGHLKGYAQGHTLPSKWVFACAIDVISFDTSPVSIIDEKTLFELWVKPGLRAGKSTNEISEKLKTWQCSEHITEQVMQQAGMAL